MPYHTDEKLKGYLDTNQLHREQMCRAILATDKRYSDVRPRHPRGGPDGGRDIEAIYRENQVAYGAVGFSNQANDSAEQKRAIKQKFRDDLASAISDGKKPEAFVFFTNLNMTVGEKESLISDAKESEIKHCEIFDRERIRIVLDSPDGFFIRFQFLNIPLSEAEQASFFARWGDDIQSVIATGFQRIERTLDRVLFFQEASDCIDQFVLSFELKRTFQAEEIGHFRAFCLMSLKEPKHHVFGIAFGSSDRSNRMRSDKDETELLSEPSGIKFGVSGGQWESYIGREEDEASEADSDDERYVQVGSSSSVGRKEVAFIPISYNKDSFIRFEPTITMRDLDEAMFLPVMNKSLAEKVKAIHVYSNGYKIMEIGPEEFVLDESKFETSIPVKFTDSELDDPWVRVRPAGMFSAFHIRFFEKTPKRLFVPAQVTNSLEKRGGDA